MRGCTTRSELKHFSKKAGQATVVDIAAVGGLTALRTGAPYGMTKAALMQMRRNLVLEWAPDHIRVNIFKRSEKWRK